MQEPTELTKLLLEREDLNHLKRQYIETEKTGADVTHQLSEIDKEKIRFRQRMVLYVTHKNDK